MVSGVGPANTLQALNILIIADRPGVGQRMQDHVLFAVSYEVNVATHSRLQDPIFTSSQIQEYVTNRTGVLTNSASELRKYLQNDTLVALSELPSDWPEVELIFADGVGIQAPFSRGNVTTNSTDTAHDPVINPNLLGDARDVGVAVQGFRRARQIAQTDALQKIIIGEEAFPANGVQSDAEIRQLLTQASNTIYHASYTNSMGRSNDTQAAVDSEARVIGVQTLRVVDASIFPFLPAGHPQNVSYVLADKIAELIQNT